MSNDYPPVTIGMPVFNGANFLCQALDSLLAQDYKNISIVISDNASTDETEHLCLRYAQKYRNISYHRNKKTVSALSNFKKVLKSASGEYFMWAASDDLWAPIFVSSLVRELESHSMAGVAMSAVGLIDELSNLTSVTRFEGEANPNFLDYYGLLAGITDYGLKKKKYNYFIYGLFRRELIAKAIRFYPNVFAADRLLMCELALATRFRYVDEVLHYRRIHPQSFYERYPNEKISRVIKNEVEQHKAVLVLGVMLLVSNVIPLSRKRYIPFAFKRFRALIKQNISREKQRSKQRLKEQV